MMEDMPDEAEWMDELAQAPWKLIEDEDLGRRFTKVDFARVRQAGFAMVEGLIWDEHQLPEVFCGRLRD